MINQYGFEEIDIQMVRERRFNLRRFELYLTDTLIMCMAFLFTYIIDKYGNGRFHVDYILVKLLVFIGCTSLFRYFFKLYQNIWRYASSEVYTKILISDLLSGFLFAVLGRIFPAVHIGLINIVILSLLLIVFTIGSRLFYQLYYAHYHIRTDKVDIENIDKNQLNKENIAIVGAGNVGASLAAELSRNPRSYYVPYCFIDNDKIKIGCSINGVPIIAENQNTIDQLKEQSINTVVIAIPDAPAEEKKRLYDLYSNAGCNVKLYDYLQSNTTKPTLRNFTIEEVLFRDAIKVNSEQAKSFYTGKVVMVTGGGGSIGSELCRQIAKLNPKELVIVDIYENNAYEIQQELIRQYGSSLNLKVFIASVRDPKRLEEIFRTVRPNLVFHAAAHKHVPLMEESSCEAIKNNVLGTYNTANLAEKYGTEKFLLISTDKAVNPTNIMGASKRLCEMVIQCRHNSKTEFTAVRFGNVLGSNGSVIPLFKRQIEAGGPVTLTDKRIIRYFMTIPEAVGLVMETCAMAHNGELFVLDMGKPVKILDLAENMIRLSGLKPYEDIDIIEIGLRPGEKLYEELLMKTEELDKTDNDMIFIERDKGLSREEVEEKLAILKKAVEQEGYESVRAAIRATVPTYKTPEEVNAKALDAEEMKNVKEN